MGEKLEKVLWLLSRVILAVGAVDNENGMDRRIMSIDLMNNGCKHGL